MFSSKEHVGNPDITMLFNYTSYNNLTFIFKFDMLSLSVFTSICIVISLLIIYIPWYMATEPNKFQFYLLIGFFSSSILFLSITKLRMIFLVFWEFLRISSYLLVSWWGGRQLARSLAVVRLLSSRVRDICLFLILASPTHIRDTSYNILFVLAISSKSAQFFYFPWLLRAIERPRPVSALLHSSTLVLARVILCFRIKDYRCNSLMLIARLLRVVFRVLRTYTFLDLKRRVACSTVYNVRFLFIWIYLGEYDLMYLHIIFHAVVKSSTFVLLRITTHLMYVQDVRRFLRYTHKQISNVFIILLVTLSALPLVRLRTYKETAIDLLLDSASPIVLKTVLFLLSWVRLRFVIEYILLVLKGHNSYTKILPLPSFLHGHMVVSFPVSFLIHSFIAPVRVNNVRWTSSFILFLAVRFTYVTLSYGLAINWDINNYLANYNAMLLDNITHLKRLTLRVEFFTMFQLLKNSEWYINKNWSHRAKLSLPLFVLRIIYTLFICVFFR